MPGPLVETKLRVPRVRPGAVRRTRLDDLLVRGSTATLTLVSAPAGFGKATLLASWLESSGQATAWVSLDEGDVRRLIRLRDAQWSTIGPGGGPLHRPQGHRMITVIAPPTVEPALRQVAVGDLTFDAFDENRETT